MSEQNPPEMSHLGYNSFIFLTLSFWRVTSYIEMMFNISNSSICHLLQCHYKETSGLNYKVLTQLKQVLMVCFWCDAVSYGTVFPTIPVVNAPNAKALK